MTQDTAHPPGRPDMADGEQNLVERILASRTSGQPATAKLETDDRVIARITDGIYRQPSSALRELISNAYDADATEVIIETDVPRFREIRVRDDGQGMDEAALARLILHIGGSSKRTTIGAVVGTTDEHDPNLSKAGRKLIGKIGIGLFSVNQLTSHFQIITKKKGSNYRLFADVTLRVYSDEELPADAKFESGNVEVTSVPAEDIDAQGTEIILKDIRPSARTILSSSDVWSRQFAKDDESDADHEEVEPPPPWHSGYIDPQTEDGASFLEPPSLPWKPDDPPLVRFQRLFDAVSEQTLVVERPELGKTLDTYLAMLWTLSLSSPVPYLEKHPFDLGPDEGVEFFQLSNTRRGRADPIILEPGEVLREKLGLKAGAEDPAGGFQVFIDQVELRRPISFKFWQGRNPAFTKPMLFVGSYRPNLEKLPRELRGGNLAFEGYLLWNNKVVPKENTGVLIRINGASNAQFDDGFMRYQVSEQTRLKQITSEIFVSKGLDAALNIDRESFNFAHTHYRILSNWMHRGLRQLATTHKAIGDDIRSAQRASDTAEQATKLDRFTSSAWMRARSNPPDPPPRVEVFHTPIEAMEARERGVIALDQSQLPGLTSAANARNAGNERAKREQVAKAIATVLDGYGVLSDMPYARQHELIAALIAVFYEDAQDA